MIGPEYELPIEMKIGLKENSDLCGAAVDPRRHREPVLRQGGYRLGQEDERQQAEMKIEKSDIRPLVLRAQVQFQFESWTYRVIHS